MRFGPLLFVSAKESFVTTPTVTARRNELALNTLESYLDLFYQLIMTHYTDTSSLLVENSHRADCVVHACHYEEIRL